MPSPVDWRRTSRRQEWRRGSGVNARVLPCATEPETRCSTMNTWIAKGDKITRCRVYGAFGATLSRSVAHVITGHFLYEVFSVGSTLVTDLRTMSTSELPLFSSDVQLAATATLSDAIALLARQGSAPVSTLFLLSLRGDESAVVHVANAPFDATIARNVRDELILSSESSGEVRVFDATGALLRSGDASDRAGSPFVATPAADSINATDANQRPLGVYEDWLVRRVGSQLVLAHRSDPSVSSRSSDAVAVTSIAISDDGAKVAVVEDGHRARIVDFVTQQTEREVSFDRATRVMRFCEGGRSIAFAQEDSDSIVILSWTRGVDSGELSELFRRDRRGDEAVGSLLEINASATRILVRYPSERGSIACVCLADGSETDVSLASVVTTAAQFRGDDAVIVYCGMQTTFDRSLVASAPLPLDVFFVNRWNGYNLSSVKDARALLPGPLVDWWSKTSVWYDMASISASPSAAVIAANPAQIGLFSINNATSLSTLSPGAQRLAKIARVAVAKDSDRFVVALDSGQILLCEFV